MYYLQKILGSTKNRLSFYYSGYQLRGGDAWMSATEASEKAEAAVNEAIEIFKEVSEIYTFLNNDMQLRITMMYELHLM